MLKRERDACETELNQPQSDGDGGVFWYSYGLHRDHGLKYRCIKGVDEWNVNGRPHRVNDLPARQASDGYANWSVNGKSHRKYFMPAYISRIEYAWIVQGEFHSHHEIPAKKPEEYHIRDVKVDIFRLPFRILNIWNESTQPNFRMIYFNWFSC